MPRATHFSLQELSALSFRTRVTCAHAHYTLLKKQLARVGRISAAKYTRTHILYIFIQQWHYAVAAALPYKLITNSFVNE